MTTKKTKKDSPEKPSQASADASGAHDQAVENLPVVVEHMKKSNEYVKQTNQELIKMNKGQAGQNKWLRVISLLLSVFIGLLGFGLWLDHQNAAALTAEIAKTNERLDAVIVIQDKTKQVAEDTKAVVEAQPLITVKPADTADPTSRPTLVVVPKLLPKSHKKGDPPPTASPPTFELHGDLPRKKK